MRPPVASRDSRVATRKRGYVNHDDELPSDTQLVDFDCFKVIGYMQYPYFSYTPCANEVHNFRTPFRRRRGPLPCHHHRGYAMASNPRPYSACDNIIRSMRKIID